MKKILCSALVLAIAAQAFAQTPAITNGSFETWTNPSGTLQLEHPTAWHCTDELLNSPGMISMFAIGNIPVTHQKQLYKSTDANDGTYAAKIVTKRWGDSLGYLPALFTNSKQSLDFFALIGAMGGAPGSFNPMNLFKYSNGTPIYGRRVDSVTAYVKSATTNTDSAIAFITAFKKVTADSNTVIGQGIASIPKNTGNAYVKINVKMNYLPGQAANTDTLIIGFVSSVVADTNNTVGNTVFVDKVSLFTSAIIGINNVKTTDLGFSVYPNPSKNYIVFDNSQAHQKCNLVVYNVVGQVMHQAFMKSGKNTIDLSKYANGIYHYAIYKSTESKQTGTFVKE